MQENWFEMCLDLPDIRDRGEQYQVDAFSDQPFGGNPAAVVFEHRDPMWMQRVAAENNLSETAFIKLRPGTIADFDIKWYEFQNFQTMSTIPKCCIQSNLSRFNLKELHYLIHTN